LRALERRIAQARRESRPALKRHPGLPLSVVQQRIPQGALLLDYYCTPREIILFLIGEAGVQVFERLAPLTAVERLTNRWRFNLESVRLALLDGQSPLPAGLLSEAHEILQELQRLLLGPVVSHLAGHDALWIVPHGPLWEVPFAALHDGEQYLVEGFELTCLPGLVEGQGKKALLSDAPLVVGYSDGGRLTHAVDEAQTVANALGGADLLLEEDATSAKLCSAAASCTLLHLATHGFFRGDAPLFSALRLADGLLTAGDLEEWHMPQVGLVTLSACETGLSLNWGSDLLGLARGFLRAGARQLVVSLWAVDDVSTAKLMARFYEELQTGQDVAPALRAAQVNVLEKHDWHPFYWAGFEPMGLMDTHQI
jgi:CHAT domain-containing protein